MTLDPELAFMQWFNSLPLWQRRSLAYLYIVMSTQNSEDFAMSEKEALQRFTALIQSPEFRARKIARLLSVRSLFGFIFYDLDFVIRCLGAQHSSDGNALSAFATHQWVRCAHQWEKLQADELGDAALHSWLAE
ncbi:MAG: hypothetical protein RBR22_01290 [Desulfuromonas sp.]|nr:hypothetical protein [Desulfuromonas sp.]